MHLAQIQSLERLLESLQGCLSRVGPGPLQQHSAVQDVQDCPEHGAALCTSFNTSSPFSGFSSEQVNSPMALFLLDT